MNKKELNRSECKGCKIIHRCLVKPKYKYKNLTEECPCQTCLIKGICLHTCCIFDEYVKSNYLNRGRGKGPLNHERK